MTDPFKPYFNAIKSLNVTEATEHTLRSALENLLNAIVALENPQITVIHEPKKDKSGLGAPDFKFKQHEAIVGYLENKKSGEPLDAVLQSDQIAKYRRLSGNILLTNYLEWIWLKGDHIIRREPLCYPSDVGHHKARLDLDKAEKVASLIAGFLSTRCCQVERRSATIRLWNQAIEVIVSRLKSSVVPSDSTTDSHSAFETSRICCPNEGSSSPTRQSASGV